MKQIGNSVTIIAVLVCAAVLLMPLAEARPDDAGTAPGQGGPGGGDMNRMPAPPAGKAGNGNSGGDGIYRAPPHGGSDAVQGTGNSTGHAPPAGGFGNASFRPNGPGNGQGPGNMTRQVPPSGEYVNATAPGNRPDGVAGFGNTTPPQRSAGEPGDFGSMENGQGPGNMTRQAPPSGEYGNATAPGHGAGAWDGGENSGQQPDSSSRQPSKEDVIADLFSRLQGLLSGNL